MAYRAHCDVCELTSCPLSFVLTVRPYWSTHWRHFVDMNWMEVLIVLSSACLVYGQEGVMDGCPDAQEDGERCQKLMQKVVSPLIATKKQLSSKEKVQICCNVAHAIDCLTTEAIPKCHEREKQLMFEQTHHFLRDSTFFRNRLFNMSCSSFEFRDHQLPHACEGLVEGYPIRNDVNWSIVAVCLSVVLVLLVLIFLFMYSARRYRHSRNRMWTAVHA